MLWTEFLPDILPEAVGCPNPVAKRAIKNATIQFCDEAEAYIHRPDPLTPVANLPELEFSLPEHTRLAKIHVLSYRSSALKPTSEMMLDSRAPGWQQEVGTPQAFYQMSQRSARIVPTPEKTEALTVQATLALAPTQRAEGVDDDFADQYYETLIAGALSRILGMQNQPWSNPQQAMVYGAAFAEMISRIKGRARGDNYAKRESVKYGGY
ncbi:hypothetical protein GCM10023116_01800 [Kistimonas scapharcae]|uniref:Uncharacterized protein n=1 Tax=Kistimonas scapharcae TaxID=1036133 RepID=A0ABP8UXJ0_9GAMM